MTVEEFHQTRIPFYLDNDTLLIKVPSKNKHLNGSHAEWFNEIDYPYLHTVRGYLYKDCKEPHIMIYWNDFEIPNVNVNIFIYLFEYFPEAQWIGVGCNKGKPGEEWTPKLKVTRNA